MSPPPDLPRAEARTINLRIPPAEWPAVSQGRKREFRVPVGDSAYQLWNVDTPCAVVAYSRRRHPPQPKPILMVLEAVRQEQLMAISPEGLTAEGCADFREFRRKWCARVHRKFEPLRLVWVFKLRPLEPEDVPVLAGRLFERLYGAHLSTKGA